MKNKTLILLAFLVLIFLLASRLRVHAQKLPSVQKTSVYAPPGIKVDGKPTEWNDKFEAMNTATNVYYTMANDDEKLYLTVQATDPAVIAKILRGGFKLSIKGANKADQPVIVTGMLVQPAGQGVSQKLKDKDAKVDSLITELNSQVSNNIKEMHVTGVKDIADTVISIYNEYDIKQAAKFDTKRAFTCELAIPLKYIAHLIIGDTFKYNFMLSGMNMSGMTVMVNGVKQDMHSLSGMAGVTMTFRSSSGASLLEGMFDPTDFSGAYTLAKK